MCSYRSKLNNENILVTHEDVAYFNIAVTNIIYPKRRPDTHTLTPTHKVVIDPVCVVYVSDEKLGTSRSRSR